MKQIEINPSNKPYYSKEFVMGFECGTKEQYDADRGVIRRIKQARQEMTAIIEHCLLSGASIKACGLREAQDIIDKLIEEEERGGADGN